MPSAAPAAVWTPPALTRWHLWLPAALLAVGTAAAWALNLDRRIAALYFDPAGPPDWPTGFQQPWHFLYMWGVVPAMGVAILGIALLVIGYARSLPWQRWAGGFILLSLLIGPFFLTNGVFHELWGRPRPRQVTEFGGDRAFRPVLLPTFHHDEQSFPTGHAAGGFSLLILYFALRPRSRRWAWAALIAGLGLGGVTAWARITQGGHFFSDGLWSAGVIWLCALAVHWGMGRWWPVAQQRPAPPRWRRWAAALAGVAASAGLLVGYLAFLPIQQVSDWRVEIPPSVHAVQAIVAVPGTIRGKEVPGAKDLRIYTTLSGRGWPWATLWERRAGPVTARDVLLMHYTAQGLNMRHGGNVSVVVVAPAGLDVTVQTMDLRQSAHPQPPAAPPAQ